jgi:TonB family protein
MPRTLKLLLLASALAAPLCAAAAAQDATQNTAASTAAQTAQQTPATAEDEYQRGRQLLNEGKAALAAPLLKHAAEARKTDADAWYSLGVAHARNGKHGDARKAFDKALKARPDWALARTGLAYALLGQGKARDAEREAQRARALDPRLADVHFVIGTIRYHEENFEQAAAEAETALRLNPNSPSAAFLYGDALLNLYFDEVMRLGKLHPLPTSGDAEARKAVIAQREAALEPFKTRMRENADRLEAYAKTWKNEAEAQRLRELADSLRLHGKLGGDSQGVFRTVEVTNKAVITSKPEPGFTDEARNNNVTGTVRLRAVLAADGRVRNIVAIKRLPAGLTDVCIEAARRIRFTPATINGAPVSQYVVLEYNFNIR